MATHFQRVAHRGGSLLAPENTLAAFRTALTLSVDAIELDVQMTKDGHAIVFHDNTVEELTDGEGNILDLDFAYLRSLNASARFPGGWPEPQRIPTLREVLNLARARTKVYVEIKASKQNGTYGRYPNIAETVVKEIRAANMVDNVLIMSFDSLILPIVKSLEPALKTAAIISEDIWNPKSENAFELLLQQAHTLQVDWLNMDSKLFTPDMAERVQAHGFKFGCWTVNTLEEMRTLAAAGIDSITSDRPDLFAKVQENQS